jgi:two-component system phosphate regulon response regulator PhoB
VFHLRELGLLDDVTEGTGHILVVDADPDSRRRIVEVLEGRSFRCREAHTARAALESIRGERPALVLLDTLLPDVSGLGICRILRESPEWSRVPVVIVSVQSSEVDRLLAFEAGADEFMAKPFYPAELAARVAAVLRGFASGPGPLRQPIQERGVVRVNRASGIADVQGRRLELTAKEFEILAALAAQPGRVMRREHLVERVWGGNAPQSERAIDAHIKSIRRKLGEARDCIETVRGVGYRFSEL